MIFCSDPTIFYMFQSLIFLFTVLLQTPFIFAKYTFYHSYSPSLFRFSCFRSIITVFLECAKFGDDLLQFTCHNYCVLRKNAFHQDLLISFQNKDTYFMGRKTQYLNLYFTIHCSWYYFKETQEKFI